ncbi:MAG: TerC/Alx family metal homeostasis membrane protein [Alphaproteobacteria bacterium]|nr:TerC/Alx family metal homeostasis membrane protein [Alphaproteobacteria bacterium]
MNMIKDFFSNHMVVSTSAMWLVFGVIVVTILFLDLFVFHKHSEAPSIKSTLKICLSYMLTAIIFGLFVVYEQGLDSGMLFYTGYLVEFSLSMDNIFVISLVFTGLSIPSAYQHRVLFWGVMGAIIMRAIMILLGESLVSNFHWVLYLFSLFLIYTGASMLKHKQEHENITDTKVYKFVASRLRVTKKLQGEHFFVKLRGKKYMTPLFFALVIIELMDVIFAIDSIPAIFLITQDVFIVYTSNIFAILGLRSLYFLLAAAVCRFRYLKPALAIILIFIGSKIFLPYVGIKINPSISLLVTFGIIASGMILSVLKSERCKTNL